MLLGPARAQTPTPKVKGDVFPPRHSNLSWLDAKGAFTTCQFVRKGRDAAETMEANETIDFDEFVQAFTGAKKDEDDKENKRQQHKHEQQCARDQRGSS